MAGRKKYVYQISTNPVNESKNKIIPFTNQEENFSFGFIGDFAIVTGMNNSVEKTIDAIQKSSFIYITGEMDQATYFELGVAISLNKTVYYVTEKKKINFDFQLPYSVDKLVPITYQKFIELVDNLND